MSDITTKITLKGTPNELMAILNVISEYETTNKAQYEETQKGSYLENVNAVKNDSLLYLSNLTESELASLIADAEYIEINADGPFGAYIELSEVKLFERMAEAAPKAYFKGVCDGETKYTQINLTAELKEGKLYLADYFENAEAGSEYYEKAMRKLLSYTKFCKLFKVDKEEFDTDCYSEFIQDAMAYEGFPDMEYDDFIEYCDSSNADEDRYEEAIEEVQELGIVDYDTFREKMDEEVFITRKIYNPKTQKYSKWKIEE